ncbi:SagB/ThcOx family dehydrogenase [Haloimpatiens lingqiaonensis]|uniref:SagB/ThcOx family dehydrogenase n=1 Tax=Haloimpatiens lingqiaonensis TaxID=1380675 RepID=UPI0010FE43CF|nr:SagB/ThcOx family dehydrogenase [Haloimpatiens lingqiaonensis]
MYDKNTMREYLKSNVFKELYSLETDQEKELPQPPVQKNCFPNAKIIDLVSPDLFNCGTMSMIDVLKHRKSRRFFSDSPLTLEELSFLIWSMQGVKKIVNNGYATLRTVPSAGARHPFETYLAVINVDSLDKGIYRYLPLEHKLVFLGSIENLNVKLSECCLNQKFVSKSAVTFILTAIPYRMEWRYDIASYKLIAMDAGHVFENLYLSAEAINCGTCAIAAYDQQKIDKLINVNGEDEFTIYIAPVGKQL